jgi:hypothetical protein
MIPDSARVAERLRHATVIKLCRRTTVKARHLYIVLSSRKASKHMDMALDGCLWRMEIVPLEFELSITIHGTRSVTSLTVSEPFYTFRSRSLWGEANASWDVRFSNSPGKVFESKFVYNLTPFTEVVRWIPNPLRQKVGWTTPPLRRLRQLARLV